MLLFIGKIDEQKTTPGWSTLEFSTNVAEESHTDGQEHTLPNKGSIVIWYPISRVSQVEPIQGQLPFSTLEHIHRFTAGSC